MKMQAEYLGTTRRARSSLIVVLLAALALALLAAAPLVADTVTTGTASGSAPGTDGNSKRDACAAARIAADADANCSDGTLAMGNSCSCVAANPDEDGIYQSTECTLDWTCTLSDDTDEEDDAT